MKVKILSITKGRDFIVEEVEAEPCKELVNCAWIQRDGQWFIYDVKIGKVLWWDDSRAFLESRMWEFRIQIEIIRSTDVYKRRVQQFREMAGI